VVNSGEKGRSSLVCASALAPVGGFLIALPEKICEEFSFIGTAVAARRVVGSIPVPLILMLDADGGGGFTYMEVS
jgi:hypothetical protein